MSGLIVENLTAGYGDLEIIHEVDLTVDPGEYVAIVGPNGAGKSTTIKALMGLTSYREGTITFNDQDIQDTPTQEVIKAGIGYVPQSGNVFESLTVEENLKMGAYTLNSTPPVLFEEVYDRFPVLGERRDKPAETLSGGERQMLAMGRALMVVPSLLVLDEPSAGLAPDLAEEMFDRIDEINDTGTSVLMVEQNANEALQRCDRGYVLVDGEPRYVDSGNALLTNDTVRQDFLGGT